MASRIDHATPNDCLQLYSTILASAPDSPEQRESLDQLLQLLELHPTFIPILYQTLVGLVSGPQGSVPRVRRWVAQVIELALGHSGIGAETKMQLCQQSTEPLLRLLSVHDPHDPYKLTVQRLAIQSLACAYSPLFVSSCAKPSDSRSWDHTTQLKTIALGLLRNTATNIGVRIASARFASRVIQIGTKGIVDPRRRGDDPSTAMIPASHPYLKAQKLELEALSLLEDVVKLLYSTPNSSLAGAMVASIGYLIRQRPSHANLLVAALCSWTPASLAVQSSPTAIRGVEKHLRIILSFLARSSSPSDFTPILHDALSKLDQRMKAADAEAKAARERQATVKRQRIAEELAAAPKRQKTTGLPTEAAHGIEAFTSPSHGANISSGAVPDLSADFDVKSLPLELVVELVIATMQMTTDEAFQETIRTARSRIPGATNTVSELVAPPIDAQLIAVDPMKMDLDEDEIKFTATKPDDEVDAQSHRLQATKEAPVDDDDDVAHVATGLDEFQLEPPERFSEAARAELLKFTVDGMAGMRIGVDSNRPKVSAVQDKFCATIMVRLATRGLLAAIDQSTEVGAEMERRREDIRQTCFDFVVADWTKRAYFARLWLNEEWICSKPKSPTESSTAYERWTSKVLSHVALESTNPDAKAYSSFLMDLPCIPHQEIKRLRHMCDAPDQLEIGFGTLRDISSTRPPSRQDATDELLAMTTHSKRQTRNAAIVSVKSLIDNAAIRDIVFGFATKLLDRVVKPQEPPVKSEAMDKDVVSKGGDIGDNKAQITHATVVKSQIMGGLPVPDSQAAVLQHMELILALSVKNPELLDPVFAVYPTMSTEVQQFIPGLMTPLFRTLGAKSPKVVELIRNCPPGSELLVLRMLTVLTDKGRPPPAIVEAMKALASEQELSPQFIVFIIAELEKPQILRHLPKMVSMLDGTPTQKAVIKGVFESVVEQPPLNFGSVSTNAPRVKSSELLTPVELLVCLHRNEKDTGLKQAIEAIGVCFSLTDVFKPEVLAAFMQQVVDELTLPTLFLRTVIQSVQTYKSLQPFVSTTLLSRMIIKKIWTQPQLWEGFMRCAKIIAPHSFGALLQLPKDQLREVVAKQPGLKAPLRDYVIKKAGSNQSRVANVLEILSDTNSSRDELRQDAPALPSHDLNSVAIHTLG